MTSPFPRLSHAWSRIQAIGPLTLLHAGVLALVNWRVLKPLRDARADSALGRLLAARPEVWGMVLTPYLAAHWSGRDRVRRVIDHCSTIERLGPLLDRPVGSRLDLLVLDELDPAYRIALDQPRWMLRDGLAAFGLWEGEDCLFSLSYCLSSSEGRLVAYVGGVQGRREEGVLERYRSFTKRAHGGRPSDMTVELFRLYCAALKVDAIYAVSDAIQHRRSRYSRFYQDGDTDVVRLRYDDLWQERGGVHRPDGFYELSVVGQRRAEIEVKPNKRALYRRRYAALDAIAARLGAAVRHVSATAPAPAPSTSPSPGRPAGATILTIGPRQVPRTPSRGAMARPEIAHAARPGHA